MKVWISKYALTRGIYEEEVEFSTVSKSTSMVVSTKSRLNCYHEGEWHLSEERARARALELVQRKLKSLAKQREKLLRLADEYGTRVTKEPE